SRSIVVARLTVVLSGLGSMPEKWLTATPASPSAAVTKW
ncbi:MAG: hypothetical protein JWO57_3205, partial [Pseudonocardiales bacterium]|nr:hypothetical protein [Pseudonocardiales bacterium]